MIYECMNVWCMMYDVWCMMYDRYAALRKDLQGVGGIFIDDDFTIVHPRAEARDKHVAKKLWEVTEKLVSQ